MKTNPLRCSVALISFVLVVPLCGALENDAARRDQLKKLLTATRLFAELNAGKAPTQVSQLLDENLLDGPADLMRPGATSVPPRAELDARSEYTFEPLPGATNMVIREKSPLPGEGEILAAFKDGTIRGLPAGRASSPPSFAGGGSRVAEAAPPMRNAPPAPSPPPTRPVAPPDSTTGSRTSSAMDPGPVASSGMRATNPVTAPRAEPTWPEARRPPSPPIPNPSGGVTTRGAEVVAEPPQDIFAVMLETARQTPGQRQTTSTSATDPHVITESNQPVRVTRLPDGTIIASAGSTEFDGRFAQGAGATVPREMQPARGDATAEANTSAAGVNRRSDSYRRQESPPARRAGESPRASYDVQPPSARARWRVTRQFVQGMPWHTAGWSEAEANAAAEEREKAVRAKDHVRLIKLDTDLAGYFLRHGSPNATATSYLSAVRNLQEGHFGLSSAIEWAYTLNNLGVAQTGDPKAARAAEAAFAKAKEIWEMTMRADSIPSEDYAVLLHNFAVFRKIQGYKAEAARLEQMADAILSKRRAAGLP